MSEAARSQRFVASVLIIAADPNIESLVAELVAFAGHRPVHDATVGAAGESLRRMRPDVVLLDASLPETVVGACLNAADEVSAQPVLMSSTATPAELERRARSANLLYFALPGGPRPLARILERAISAKPTRPLIVVTEMSQTIGGRASVHPALCAALSSVGRGRPQSERRTQAALRAAVTDYARQLHAEDVPIDTGLSLVQKTLCDCAAIVGAQAAMARLLHQLEHWTRQAYKAAELRINP